MSQNNPRFRVGQNVRYISTGKIGTVNEILPGIHSSQYKITIDGVTRAVPERFLEPIVDSETDLISEFLAGNHGDWSDYRLFQTWYRLSRPLEGNIYSYLGSKTLFNPYQFKPLLRFLSPSSDNRLFIADEVGVGKTIEVGIIMKELMARGLLDYRSKILVVCPHSLGPKWISELRDRFGLHFHLHDGDSLMHMLKTILKEGICPQSYLFSVVGLQLIRYSEYYNLMEAIFERHRDPFFDLTVIDECHHMRNSETDSYKLGLILSNLSERLLMLSATPLNLKSEDLFNQMHILNPAAFPDKDTFSELQAPAIKLNRIRRVLSKNDPSERFSLIDYIQELRNDLNGAIFNHPGMQRLLSRLREMRPLEKEEIIDFERLLVNLSPLFNSFTRTRKREALEHQVIRTVQELPIELTEEERRITESLLNTIEEHFIRKGLNNAGIGLIMNIHHRMASSCLPATREYLRWAIEKEKILTDIQDDFEIEEDEQLQAKTLDPDLKQKFEELIKNLELIAPIDSKYQQFKKVLRKVIDEYGRVIVFSFFVRTLEYLKKRLERDGFTVGIIHGGVPLKTEGGVKGRYEIMEDFKSGRFQVLLSSEVGGEGLDFQYCSAIVNYDMPYNPMRVEQRIGRIDRFGQTAEKILVVNLFIKGTVDEEIYNRLYKRIKLIEDNVGTLEPILGMELAKFQTEIITGTLSESEKEERQRRIEEYVMRAKKEMEEFERSRYELLCDDYLATPIDGIPKSNFVTPDDAVQLTSICASRWEGCSFSFNGEYGILRLSSEAVSRLERFLKKPGNEGGFNELKILLENHAKRAQTKVVFDGRIAERRTDFQFLSPTGIWSKFLIHELEQEKIIKKTFKFKVGKLGELPKGEYVVFLFEVKMEGLRTEIELIGVPVKVGDFNVFETNFLELPRMISSSKMDPLEAIQEFDLNPLLDSARQFLDSYIEEKTRIANEENRFRVESKIAALKKSTEISIRQIDERINKHFEKKRSEGIEPSADFVRMENGKKEKLRLLLEHKISELERQKILTMDYSLAGIVYLSINGETNV